MPHEMRSVVQKKPRRVSTLQKKSNFENISNRNTLLIERAHLNIYKIIVYTAIITNIKDVGPILPGSSGG